MNRQIQQGRQCWILPGLGWAGFSLFFPGIASVDLFPVLHRNLLWHFWDHHAQTEANTQRGFAISASSASCFGNCWVGFAFWTAPNRRERFGIEWTSLSFPCSDSGMRNDDYFTSLACIVLVFLAACPSCFFLLRRGHVRGISLWDPGHKNKPLQAGRELPSPTVVFIPVEQAVVSGRRNLSRDAEIAVAELGSCVGELQKRILALAGGDKSRILYLGHSLVPLTAPWGWFKVKSN